eukprot:PITA_35324
MEFNGLRLEYALDGSSNYIYWKDRMEPVLEDNGLKDIIDQEVPKLVATNAKELVEWKKCLDRARRILLKGVRDHIIWSLHGKETSFSMWKTLKDQYQNSSNQSKLTLKGKLQKVKCEKAEIRRTTRDGSSSKDDEEKLALASKARKGKEKDSHPNSSSSHGGKKIDKSKVRCFNYHEVGHYATNCPLKKSKKGSSEESEGEALASQFELDFTLITCMVSSMIVCGWFLDSGASFHMTDDKSFFNTLEEKDLKILIEMGNDEKYSVSGVGTVYFQREHGARITLTDVKYVKGLKKNLVSIAMLEDKGYDVVFSKGKVFLRHITTI